MEGDHLSFLDLARLSPSLTNEVGPNHHTCAFLGVSSARHTHVVRNVQAESSQT